MYKKPNYKGAFIERVASKMNKEDHEKKHFAKMNLKFDQEKFNMGVEWAMTGKNLEDENELANDKSFRIGYEVGKRRLQALMIDQGEMWALMGGKLEDAGKYKENKDFVQKYTENYSENSDLMDKIETSKEKIAQNNHSEQQYYYGFTWAIVGMTLEEATDFVIDDDFKKGYNEGKQKVASQENNTNQFRRL